MHGGVDNIRYSPLAQINKSNVTQLKVAWTYDSKDAFPNSEMQSHPVVVDGTLYVTTPSMKVAAVDAATGQERWTFDLAPAGAPRARFRCFRRRISLTPAPVGRALRGPSMTKSQKS